MGAELRMGFRKRASTKPKRPSTHGRRPASVSQAVRAVVRSAAASTDTKLEVPIPPERSRSTWGECGRMKR